MDVLLPGYFFAFSPVESTVGFFVFVCFVLGFFFFLSLFFWGGVIGRFVAVSGFTQKHLIFFKLFAEKCVGEIK